MMLARKCDRCGKLYESYRGGDVFRSGRKANALSLIDRDERNDYAKRATIDLCNDCMEKLEAFLENGGEQDGEESTPKASDEGSGAELFNLQLRPQARELVLSGLPVAGTLQKRRIRHS